MIIVRQSTSRTVMVGPVLDADGVAVTDGVVGDLKISKNGGSPAALNGSATLTHRHTGHYSLALTSSDLDTVGQAEVVMDDTVNAMPPKELTVVEEAVYDALFASSAPGYVANAPVNVAQFGGTNGTFSSGRPEVNTSHIAGNSAAAAALDRSARTIVRFTVGSGSTTTNIVTSAMDPAAAVADQFKGRIVLFDRDTTSANLRGQGSDISASTDTGELTVTALTNAPVSGDTGVIL